MTGLVYGLMVTAFRLEKSAVDAVSKRCNRVEAPLHLTQGAFTILIRVNEKSGCFVNNLGTV